MSPVILRFPAPAQLVGKQLEDEIAQATGKPTRVVKNTGELEVTGPEETDTPLVEQAIAAHVAISDYGVPPPPPVPAHDHDYAAPGHTHPDPVLSGSKAWDPPSIAAAAETTTTVNVTGAQLGMAALTGLSTLTTQAGSLTASVSAPGVVTVTLSNLTGAAMNLGAGTLNVKVFV